jgi:CheY-like chemotaxis protein
MQALHIVSNKPRNYFDLIVLDINMPIMGGLEACERIYNYLSQESSFFGIL